MSIIKFLFRSIRKIWIVIFAFSLTNGIHGQSFFEEDVFEYIAVSEKSNQEIINEVTKILSEGVPKKHEGKGIFYAYRAAASVNLGKYYDAYKDFEKAVEVDSNNALIYSARGEAKSRFPKLFSNESIVEDYFKAISLNPNLPHPYIRLALILSKEGKYGLAEEAIQKAIALDPQSYTVNLNSALCMYYKNASESALEYVDNAIRINPNSPEPYYYKGLINFDNNKAESINDFSSAIELDPKNSEYLLWRGKAYLALEDFSNARMSFNDAIGYNYNNAEAYYNRALMWAALDQGTSFRMDVERAYKLRPKNKVYKEAYQKIYGKPDSSFANLLVGFALIMAASDFPSNSNASNTTTTKNCSYCGGSGYTTCFSCSGSGSIYTFGGPHLNCGSCAGTGRQDCYYCQ